MSRRAAERLLCRRSTIWACGHQDGWSVITYSAKGTRCTWDAALPFVATASSQANTLGSSRTPASTSPATLKTKRLFHSNPDSRRMFGLDLLRGGVGAWDSLNYAACKNVFPLQHRAAKSIRGTTAFPKSSTSTQPDDGGLSKTRTVSPGIGFVAGAVGSVVGVGGGTLIVPMVSNFCTSIPQRVISGTSLAAVISTGLVASYTYGASASIDYSAAVLVSTAAMLGAPFGARMTMVLDNAKLKRILGYFLMAAAVLVPLKSLFMQDDMLASNTAENASSTDSSPPQPSTENPWDLTWPGLSQMTLLSGTGLIAGVASGLLGIGGGTIVTPLLAIATSMPQTHVVGTSLCAMIPPSIVGLIQHHRLGNVDWRLGLGLALGTMIGGFAGSNLALTIPDSGLKGVFAVAMFSLGRLTLAKGK
ncbi:hypothetical protein BSKO_08428 [Bryopsis sp. KO-2023]|nr:hypothetical protein BSKO_08428 [Bryopsis sp. KO-2023]